ncbi:MAG: ribonuclease HII [Lachnospiraceae bacterium]|nr:ribonuclease HII [Lachnospiraceae bacterium]
MVVSAVIMNNDSIIDGVRDSKTISENKREKLYEELMQNSKSVGIGWIDPKEIDNINILEATRKAFIKAIDNLEIKPDFVLMDYITGVNTDYPFIALKKGDSISYIIGCASIIAKVKRDRYMIEIDKEYPMYGFARNKGYGTKEHIYALKKYGPCPIHRKSFLNKILGDKNE